MSAPRLPSPLRPLSWNGAEWIAREELEPPPAAGGRYSPAAVGAARVTWRTWAAGEQLDAESQETATNTAVDYLQIGLPAGAVASLVRARVGRGTDADLFEIQRESAHVERVISDVPRLIATGVLTSASGVAVEREYRRRHDALAEHRIPLVTQPVTPPVALAAVTAPAPAPPVHVPATPPEPPFSLRAVFAEHSVLVLAALGAFLLVVATVLFELYGTIGLGGSVRLAAIVALDALFAGAGIAARRRKGLESVGHIYIALAAVLLPLVGLAAWTFLALDSSGITVYQALGVTALACAGAYGLLAQRLELRPYGAMAGLAVLVAAVGLSGWIGGEQAVPVGFALTPLVYAAAGRLLSTRAFGDLPWFAHAGAVLAALDAVRFAPGGWLWSVTLGAIAFSYLVWNGVARERLRAWIGEGAAILAAAAAVGPLGLDSYQFALPLASGVPLAIASRTSDRFGDSWRAFRPHVAHLHAAVVAGVGLAAAESFDLDSAWPLAAGLAIATALYVFDYALAPTVLTGATLRASALLAVAVAARAAGSGPWTASITALGLLSFAIPFVSSRLSELRAFASYFYYAGFVLVVGELYDSRIGQGQWPVPVALALSAIAFGTAAELKAVPLAAYAGRIVFSGAWFAGVDGLGASDWRGPFDAVLAPLYVALDRVRALAGRASATAGRRWLVHGVAVAALFLSVNGPSDMVWWRLAAASAALTVAYWWIATVRKEVETPWLAWLAASLALGSLSVAALPGAWPGAGIASAAVLLTLAWAIACRWLPWRRLDEAGLVILTLLSATGMTVATVEGWLEWPQAVAVFAAAVFFCVWSVLQVSPFMTAWRSIERCAASACCIAGLAVTAGVLSLDTSVFALGALVIAALHAEWNVRSREAVERWYAIAVVLGLVPAVYLWPYANQEPLVVAFAFAAIAFVVLRTATRTGASWLAAAAVLVLAPALELALTGLQVQDRHVREAAFAVLAWLAGFAGALVRRRSGRRWSLSTGIGGLAIAVATIVAMAGYNDADQAGVALLAFAPLLYVFALQERSRVGVPAAPASALAGVVVLLSAHGADTLYDAAALGVVGLLMWLLGLAAYARPGRSGIVDVHRYVGLGLLTASGLAGFGFPTRTGPVSLGSLLATVAFVVTGGVLLLDARRYEWRPNLYIAIVAASTGAFFAARFVSLESWELVGPGIGLIVAGVAIRRERSFHVDIWLRRLAVAVGLGLVFGWATALTIVGDIWWLVALLVEATVAVAAGVVVRNRVLLAGGGAALALASLRALLLIAQAGFLFIAFGVVALILLAGAAALALGRERYLSGAREARDRIASWD